MPNPCADTRRRATDLIIGGRPLTPAEMTDPDAAGPPSTVDEVLRDLVDHGCRRLADRVAGAGIIRRRSVTEVLVEGMQVFWDDVTGHREHYRAVLILQRSHPGLRVTGPDGDVTLNELPPAWAVRWLDGIATMQDITWNTPVPVLARLMTATLSGLVTHAVCAPDDATEDTPVRALFQLLAYDVAQHSTRNRRPAGPR